VNVTTAYPGTFPDAYEPDQSGTSFAAAFVSGVAALVRAAHPRLTAAQVVARIKATARGPAGPGTGRGMVDPVRAVTAVLPAEPAATAAQRPSAASTSAVTRAVIAGSFGLVVVVVVTAGLAVARRRRDGGRGGGRADGGRGGSGRHAA
jgi:membrane-anchored mycosin MYCP